MRAGLRSAVIGKRRMSKRKRAYWLGRGAEHVAALMLNLKGYRIIARRYRSPFGEIDLIALRCGTLCFVEVKARKKMHTAREALTSRQKQRIARSAGFWLQRHRQSEYRNMRFDVILIAPWCWPLHIPDAFPAED